LNKACGTWLIALARKAISEVFAESLHETTVEAGDAECLQQQGATFVTLTIEGRLRGCIGSLTARRSLREDVQANAVAAAFHDPRFAPLTSEEWTDTSVEVSVLGEARAIHGETEEQLRRALVPFQDGLILRYKQHQATFLPQVWQQLPQAALFLQHLKLKAGLPADFWSEDMQMSVYTVEKFSDHD